MGLFDFFKSKKRKARVAKEGEYYLTTTLPSDELAQMIYKSISAFMDNPTLEDHEVLEKIILLTGDTPLARAIYLFIPEVFCMLTVPEPNYPDFLIILREPNEQISYKLSSEPVFKVVMTTAKKYLEENKYGLLNIVKYSSRMDAINNALNGGKKLEEVDISPLVFID